MGYHYPILSQLLCFNWGRGGGNWVWWENMRERDHLEDPGIGGRIILRWTFIKWDVGGIDWIDLAQDRDRWRRFVKAVMNHWVP
jgi:hypothetical protein